MEQISCVFFFFFFPHSVAYGILIPRSGIELTSPALETWNLNHWTTREVHFMCFLKKGMRCFFLPRAWAEASVTSQAILSTSQGRGETPAKPGRCCPAPGLGIRLPCQVGGQERPRARSREPGIAEQALRRKGRRGITGDYSPISKLLLFSKGDRGKYSNFLQ